MPNISALSKAEWQEVRRTVESGLGMRETAEHYGVDYEALRKRAQRESWITQRVRSEAIAKYKAENESRESPASPKAIEVIAKTVAEKGEILRLKALELADKGISHALRQDLSVESWQDAKIAWEIGAKAAGIDKSDSTGVTILFGAPPSAIEPSRSHVHDVDAEQVNGNLASEDEIL
jgi:hypothetical protein